METVFREVCKLFHIFRYDQLNNLSHIHDAVEVVYIIKGGGLAFCDGRRYVLQPGSFFLAFPNQVHYFTDCVQGEYITLQIYPFYLRYHSNVFESGLPESAIYSGNPHDLVSLLETTLKEYEAIDCNYNTLIGGLMTVFFEKLLKGYTISKNQQANNCLVSVVRYCNQHYLEDISIETLSRELHFSRFYISRLFNARIPMSFTAYINHLRLGDAVKLLHNRSRSIAEIAFMSGFSSLRTFNRVFKEQYGMSPSEYRKSLSK